MQCVKLSVTSFLTLNTMLNT